MIILAFKLKKKIIIEHRISIELFLNDHVTLKTEEMAAENYTKINHTLKYIQISKTIILNWI